MCSDSAAGCGGACPPCGYGLTCNVPTDCASNVCVGGLCDLRTVPATFPVGVTLTSLDSADGQNLYGTLNDWTILVSGDGAHTWHEQIPGSSSEQAGRARIHVSRANPDDIVTYAIDYSGSNYDDALLVSHDGLATVTANSAGDPSWGDIAAFSWTDASTIYFFGDNEGSFLSTNAGDSSTELSPSPELANGDLWYPGAAEIDPLNSKYAWASVIDEDSNAHLFSLYDGYTGSILDLTSTVTPALGGQAPAGFEVFPVDGGSAYRLRLVGQQGALMFSDDEGTTFNPIGVAGLPSCGGSVDRQLVSAPHHRAAMATWCPGTGELAFATTDQGLADGGVAWTQLTGGAWANYGCSSIAGVAMNDSQIIVGCTSGDSVLVDYLGESRSLPDGGTLAATCFDGVKDGTETAVDCGGSCEPCLNTQPCQVDSDCASGDCGPGPGAGGLCAPPSCTDGVRDGLEVSVDCGGPTCAGCPGGTACTAGFECDSLICAADGGCTVPTCSDGVENGNETGVDCGGSCPPCEVGNGCKVPGDCTSGMCTSNVCDVTVTDLTVAGGGIAFTSIDTADGVTLWATTGNWTVYESPNAGATWNLVYTPVTSERSGQGRIHVDRADPNQILVYAYTDTQTSTYDDKVIVSHSAFGLAADGGGMEPDGGIAEELTNGISSWGDICAFSESDPVVIYYLGDNGGSVISTNAGDTTTSLSGADFSYVGGLWTAGAAEVDPLDPNRAWASMAGSNGSPVTSMGQYDLSTQGTSDLTPAVTAALLGQTPGGFEVYPISDGGFELRVVGVSGAIALSDDEAGSFHSASSDGGLEECGSWASHVRQIGSYPGDHASAVTWCPKTNEIAVSRKGGSSWGDVSRAPSWQTSGCSSIGGVVLTASTAVVACTGGSSVVFSY